MDKVMPEALHVENRLLLIREHLHLRVAPIDKAAHPFVLFMSVSDGDRRARVVTAAGNTLEQAWQAGVRRLTGLMRDEGIAGRWIRVDWPVEAMPRTWRQVRALLGQTKRNYFRLGISLDAGFACAFTEQELNANAMLYGGNTIESAVLNERNFLTYAVQRFAGLRSIDFGDTRDVFLFRTEGVFCGVDGRIHDLDLPGLEIGRRRIDRLEHRDLLSLVRNASDHLARQVQADGSFIYGYHPCFDRRIDAYNTLRHASTTYAMIEAWEVTGDQTLRAAIDRSLGYMTTSLIRDVRLPDGSPASFLVDVDDEIKLGGLAVAILALAKFTSVTGSLQYIDIMERLALGISHMQDLQTGAFVHVLGFPSLEVKHPFRTIYYEGEAAFALMRLYDLTADRRWLDMVEKAFEHFIRQEYWKYHDHWLGYCVNEFTRHRPDERYLRFGIRNVAGHLNFVETRITTFPTLLEQMMAARETLSRIDADPAFHHLLSEIDLRHFEKALEKRAHYLLNGHFWPEMAMYFRKPDNIAGSFFIRHHAFRVRIDDVEHYLSGLIAYMRYLPVREAFRRLVEKHSSPGEDRLLPVKEPAGWTAAHVEAATGGRWISRPPEGWMATGLSTYWPAARPGHLVAMRLGAEGVGVASHQLRRVPEPSGVLTQDPSHVPPDMKLPVIQVSDTSAAVLAMGRYARCHMKGKISAVTGSAGKTTVVAMLAHALAASGDVAKSAHNANLPIGVAWNLASMPWDLPNVVLELAIGRMGVSSRMARPHVAIFTNVLPAHLGERGTIADIARTKSAIFDGMQPGGTAVIYREILERDIVEAAARGRGLRIVWYGTGGECDFRLDDYDIDKGLVRCSVEGRRLQYRIGAVGKHMALNSLAVIAAVSALGKPLEPALRQLETLLALPGRGEQLSLSIGGRRLTIIDDAYNANPGSMRAALDRLCDQGSEGRRIAVLAPMAELGPNAAAYHTELASLVESRPIDRVYVTGELYADFWERLTPSKRGLLAPTMDVLKQCILEQLEDGDTVLFKGSQSTGLHRLVGFMKEQSARDGVSLDHDVISAA